MIADAIKHRIQVHRADIVVAPGWSHTTFRVGHGTVSDPQWLAKALWLRAKGIEQEMR